MKLSPEINVAIILWLIVGALVGAVMASLGGMMGWKMIIGAIIGCIVIGLGMIRLLQQKPKTSSTQTVVALPEPEHPLLLKEVTESSGSLSPEEAREWLDDFLVRQQQTE